MASGVALTRRSTQVKLVERVAAEPPVATIDGVAATLNRLQLDAAGTSPLANLTAEQKAAIRAAVVASTPAKDLLGPGMLLPRLLSLSQIW